jgi:hypothetical protein
MARVKFKLNHAGAEEVLKVMAAGVIAEAGAAVAENVRNQGLVVHAPGQSTTGTALEADVRHGVTDRAVALVAINHPSGVAMELKHSVLTKAASAAGLEVHGQ